MILAKNKKTPLVSPQPTFYMTGFARSTHWLNPPTWIDFRLNIALKSNQCFLLNVFFALGLYDGLRTFNTLTLSPNVGWFSFEYCVEVQLMLFVKRFFALGLYNGLRTFNTLTLSPNVDWFSFEYCVEVQSMLFAKCFFCFRFIWRASHVQHIDFIPQRGLIFVWILRWSPINAFC